MIAGIVLAAGTSSRLGQPKQLLPLGTRTILEHTCALATSILDPVVVVLGAAVAEIRHQTQLGTVRIVEHPNFADGQASSLQAGLRALVPMDAIEAVVVLLGDQPLVHSAAITALIAAWQADPLARAVFPNYGGQRGNPVLFARSAWSALMTLTGDAGARQLLASGQLTPVAQVALPGEWWPRDVDTLEDYAALRAQWDALQSDSSAPTDKGATP